MAKYLLIHLFIIYILISNVCTDKKAKKKKVNKKKKVIKEEEIPSLYKWAKKNDIFINDQLTLNKNTDSSHNFFYFTSNSPIHNNTVLLKVPYDIMISQSLLDKHFKEKHIKKFEFLWDKILTNKNPFISYHSTKQLFYMGISIEDSMNKKKGSLYQKYKPYFDMYDYIDMDNYPVFFDQEELIFLSQSSFGSELSEAVRSLQEEYYIIHNDLDISTSMEETFLKYRVLTLANSVNFNNTKNNYLEYNETVVIPFIDCFRKAVFNRNLNAQYSIKKDNNDNFYFEVISTEDIPKDEEIYLKWIRLPSHESYIYYGYIEKENNLAPKFYVNVFNNLFKKDLGVDTKKSFKDIIQRGKFELNREFFDPDVVGSYYNLSKLFDKYKNKPEGRYQMMVDNIIYYLNLYNEDYSDGNINLYIKGNEKQKIVKILIHIEKRML
jgi:hypothetical protein